MLDADDMAALREVAVAYDQVGTGLSRYDAARALLEAAQSAFDSATGAFARGVGSLTDAVNASTALDEARVAVAQAHAQALINAAGLAFATGRLSASTDVENNDSQASP